MNVLRQTNKQTRKQVFVKIEVVHLSILSKQTYRPNKHWWWWWQTCDHTHTQQTIYRFVHVVHLASIIRVRSVEHGIKVSLRQLLELKKFSFVCLFACLLNICWIFAFPTLNPHSHTDTQITITSLVQLSISANYLRLRWIEIYFK